MVARGLRGEPQGQAGAVERCVEMRLRAATLVEEQDESYGGMIGDHLTTEVGLFAKMGKNVALAVIRTRKIAERAALGRGAVVAARDLDDFRTQDRLRDYRMKHWDNTALNLRRH